MSRRDREIESLRDEVATLRSRINRDREALNRIRPQYDCPSCARLVFDLELARELIDDQASRLAPLPALLAVVKAAEAMFLSERHNDECLSVEDCYDLHIDASNRCKGLLRAAIEEKDETL